MQTSSPGYRRERAHTGTPGLDEILGGGLERGRLYLVMGDPGVGKTTLALQFLLEGRRHGEPCLYVSFSETRDEIESVFESHGWPLDGLEIFEFPFEDELGKSQTVFQPAELELEAVLRPLFDMADRVQPRRTVVDGLAEVWLLAHDPRRFRRQLTALRSRFTRDGGTLVLLDDRAPPGGEIAPQTIAHGVIQLQATPPDYGISRRRLLVRKLRASSYRDGWHDYQIEPGHLVVHPQLVAAEHALAPPRGLLTSGVEAMDRLVGDVPLGASVLLLGAAGTGKSTLMAQYAHAAAARGESAAVYLFDERRETMLARAKACGLDLAPHLASGRVTVQRVDPAELSPGQLTALIRHAVEHEHASLVAIDSLNGYLASTPGEHFMMLHLRELLTYLGQQRVTVISTLVQHGFFRSGMEADVNVSYLADVIVLLSYFEQGGRIRKVISALKNRSGAPAPDLHELRIDAGGVHVGAPLFGLHGVLTGTPISAEAPEPLDRTGTDGR